MNTDLVTSSDPVLSSSWKKYKVFKKLYSGGKVEYDNHSKLLFMLCDGCILAVSIEKGPFVVSTIGPYNEDESLGTEHSEEIVTFGYFNKNINNRLILSIGSKGIFRLWKVIIKHDELGILNSVQFEYLRSWKSGQASIAEIEFDFTGQYVSTGGTDGTIQIYDAIGGFTTHKCKPHKSLITKLRFHKKRWLLFSTCLEGFIAIYDLTTNKVIVQTNCHYGIIHSFDLFEINLNSNSLGGLVTSGADNMINIWDLDQMPCSNSIGVFNNSNTIMDNQKEPSGSKKKRKKDYSLKAEKNTNTFDLKPIKQIHTSETVFSLKCTPNELDLKDGDNDEINHNNSHKVNSRKKCPWVIFSGNEKSGIQIWNPIEGSSIKTLTPKSYSSNQSAILYMFLDHQKESENGRISKNSFLILVTEDRNIVILSYPSLKLFTTFFGNTPDYIQLALFINDNPHDQNHSLDSKDDRSHDDDNNVLSLNDKNKSISCVILDSTETPQIMSLNKYPFYKSTLIGHTSTVLTMDISKCSNIIATGSKDETIRIWSTYNQECLSVLTGHTSLITALSFQKKPFLRGNTSFYLFSASNDNTLKAWNLVNIMSKNLLKPSKNDQNSIIAIHNVIAHKKEINNINISHNDKFIATCSEDRTIKVWSFPDLKLQGTCKGHLSGVWQSSFSPIEKIIASASSDYTIKIWNLNTFQCTKTLQGHDGSVLQVDFLGNGLQIISCGSDNLIKLWNINTGECIKSFSGHNDRIWTLNLLKESNLSSFSINSNQKSDSSILNDTGSSSLQKTRFMATGGSDSQLILWMDNTKQVEDEQNLKNLKRIEDLNEIDMLFNRKEYLDALNLSLGQKLQYKTYLILEKLLKPCFNHGEILKILDSDEKSFNTIRDETNSIKSVIEWIENLQTQELSTLFSFMLEWITISKTVWISNSLMYIILTKIESHKLYKVEGFVQIVQAFRSYNTKIQAHLSTLYQKSYIMDYLFLSNQISQTSELNNSNEKGISNQNHLSDEALGLTLDTLFKS
ncbi:WD repeat containing [Cryptosporidium sp. chipmunk genotype I]|uniref:WD repeat containing n=1 Tax=Cryptosporidium sp. chipmunk genotype I TaxID=1280935 RepID=UPI00351A74CD|nr:WD repeat containing [Cryptosporidium sp. chipmunk genotype I]